MSKQDLINDYIQQLYGNVGYEVGNFYYCTWAGYHAVVQVMTEGGGVRSLLVKNTRAKLIQALEDIATYKYYVERS